ncbi:MAG: c-type cytochrome [Pyrinomonadaceae bacterium]
MVRVKLLIIPVFAATFFVSCFDSKPNRFVIAESKSYEASLFRQNCAICHGVEADGKTLDDGTRVPSLREGDFKFKTEAEIYNQIANGGNGMVAHRFQLSEREMRMLADFVRRDLRGQ